MDSRSRRVCDVAASGFVVKAGLGEGLFVSTCKEVSGWIIVCRGGGGGSRRIFKGLFCRWKGEETDIEGLFSSMASNRELEEKVESTAEKLVLSVGKFVAESYDVPVG